MDRKPAPSAGAGGEQIPAGGAPGGPVAAGEGERIGPLTVERLRKEDGRGLIVYTYARHEA